MARPTSPSAAELFISTALVTYPRSISARETLVLTAFPPLWTRGEAVIGEESDPTGGLPHLADATSILGADEIIRTGDSRGRRDHLAAALADAGWATSRIAPEYRPDWKRAQRFDAAILDEDGSPLLVIETKDVIREKDAAAARDQLAQYAEEQEVPWACLQLGDRQWELFPGENPDRVRTLYRAPSPEDCGAGNRTELVDTLRETVLKPDSLDELHGLIADREVQKVVLDATLPWRSPLVEGEEPSGWRDSVPELAKHLDELRARPRYSLDPLLSWAVWSPAVKHTAAVFPLTYLFSRRYKWFRQLSASHLSPTAILEGGAGSVFKHASFRIALGFFRRDTKRTFFCSLGLDGTEAAESNPCLAALDDWFAGKETGSGYVAELTLDLPWTFAANDPEIDKIRERLGRLGDLSPLSDHFEITRGNIDPDRAHDASEEREALLFLDARDIGQDRLPEDTDRLVLPEDVDDSSRAESGDFLVSDMLQDGVQVARYDRPDPAALSRRVLRVRPRGNPPFAAYLSSYLSSPAVDRLLRAQTHSYSAHIPRLKIPELRDLPVPQLDYEVVGEIEGIEDLERDLMLRAQRIAEKRRSLFNAQGPEDFRHKARKLRETSAMLSEGLKQADSLDYKIRNFYPYPLAFPYRAISAETSLRGRYQEQLRFAENLLAFLGSLALSILEPADREEVAEKVKEEWIRGITPGGWHDLAGSACDLLGEYEDHRLANSLHRLRVRSGRRGIGPILNDLVESKNDFKHDRGPTSDREYEKGNAELHAQIEEGLENLAFLSEFPIRQVVELDTDRQGANMVLGCLRYTGDHPGLPRQNVRMPMDKYAQQPVKKGDLYVDLGESYWRPLRPFMLSRDCPKCGSREVYFLDKLDTSREEAHLKSFERGHTITEGNSFVQEVVKWSKDHSA